MDISQNAQCHSTLVQFYTWCQKVRTVVGKESSLQSLFSEKNRPCVESWVNTFDDLFVFACILIYFIA